MPRSAWVLNLVLLLAAAPAGAASDAALDALERWNQARHLDVPRETLAHDVARDHALAAIARARFAEAELFPESRVGFPVDVVVERRLVSVLGGARPPERGDLAIDLTAIVSQPSRLRLDDALSDEERRAAGPALAELYRRQNAQGRLALRAGDVAFARAQAERFGAERAVLAMHDAALVAELRAILDDREHVRALAARYGIGIDEHQEVPRLAELARAVTRGDVDRYYDAHRAEFRRLDRVQARHIRVADEALAQRLHRALEHDRASFERLARRWSTAPDAARGGALGWLRAGDWLADLAFMQAPRAIGRPTRAPGEPEAWEIVEVLHQERSDYARDSETVAWAARRAIARERARAEFEALRAEALR